MLAREIDIYNLIIIDESGSMSSIYRKALSGINETLNTIRINQKNHPEQHHFVSIVTFEDSGRNAVKFRRNRVPVYRIDDMTEKDYVPGGCTPLYDAMGISISELDKAIGDEGVAFVTIITDGYENSSVEYSGAEVRKLVSRMKEKGWTFAYIGANQDAVEVARELDIKNALNFDASEEGTERMMASYRMANTRYSEEVACRMMEESGERGRFSSEDIFDENVLVD